jgi:uncharacterized protein YkwD
MGPVALLVVMGTLLLGAPPCLDDGAAALRTRLLGAINGDRAAAGLAPLAFDPRLCRAAQERASALAAAGSVESREEDLAHVSRRLFALGYEAHSWSEQALMGSADPFAAWRSGYPEPYRLHALGDFRHLGIGVARAGDFELVSLLFALPKRDYQLRETAPLADLAAVRAALLARVNAERRAHRLPPLLPDPRLDEAAQRHAEDMLARAYYDHTSPEGAGPRERAEAAGYRARRLGENIAKGLFSPAEAVERWLASSGHRRNILSRAFTAIGSGLACGDNARGFEVIWVQDFAAPE